MAYKKVEDARAWQRRALSAADRRPPCAGVVPEVRQASLRHQTAPSAEQCLEAAARGRPRQLREGQGRGPALRRQRCRGPPEERPRQVEAALPRAERRGSLRPLRRERARRGQPQLRAVPRGPERARARTVERPPGHWPLRCLRRAGTRWSRTVRPLCGLSTGPAGARGVRAQAVRQTQGARPLHRLRRLLGRRVTLSRVRSHIVPALRRASRAARCALTLPRDRDRDGRGSRRLGDGGGGSRLSRLRQARSRRGRDRDGYPPHGQPDVVVRTGVVATSTGDPAGVGAGG